MWGLRPADDYRFRGGWRLIVYHPLPQVICSGKQGIVQEGEADTCNRVLL